MILVMIHIKRLIKLLPFIVIYLSLSCGNKSYVKIPEGVVPPDTMTLILSDIHILQASSQLGYSQNASDTSLQMAYQSIWKKYHLTDSSYNQNMRFYCDHAKLLDSVYEKVLNNLNKQKAELMGEKRIPGKQTK
jgi:hypothetical protein